MTFFQRLVNLGVKAINKLSVAIHLLMTDIVVR